MNPRNLIRRILPGLLGLAVIPSISAQTTFSNTSAITINDEAPASPYPSTITVSGLTGSIIDVNVTLTGITHPFPDDIGFLLVGPTGVSVALMLDAGGGVPLSNVNLTFDDAAPVGLPDDGPIVSGTFKPTQGMISLLSGEHPANFAAPAPASPYNNTLAAFNGTDPLGTWNLFVDDDTAPDGGSISGGWSLTINAPIPEPSTWMLIGVGFVALASLRRRNRS